MLLSYNHLYDIIMYQLLFYFTIFMLCYLAHMRILWCARLTYYVDMHINFFYFNRGFQASYTLVSWKSPWVKCIYSVRVILCYYFTFNNMSIT